MGYTTHEFTSAGLTNLYPSLYREFQVVNWSHVDVVVTELDGAQTTMMRSECPVRESDSCVVIESIKFHGLRLQKDSSLPANSQRSLPLPGKRFNIPFESFRMHPVRIEEFNCIISTVEQSMIAKNMACEISYGPLLYENRTDMELTDPRFVFQVIDPNNQLDALFVNVFGQTITLRAGRYGKLIPGTTSDSNILEQARLICYLRYPTAYFGTVKEKQIVFDIPLNDLYKREPYCLPSGDVICIAEDISSLEEVMAKKSSSYRGVVVQNNVLEKMIPKDVYEAAEENFKKDCERIKIEAKQRYDTLATQKASEIAKLQFQLQQVTQERDRAEAKVKQWEAINDVRTHVDENQQKVNLAAEKVRKEANDNAKDDIEFMKTAIKLGGTIVSGVMSFAITLLVQNAKKK